MKRLCLSRTTPRQETGDDFENLTDPGILRVQRSSSSLLQRGRSDYRAVEPDGWFCSKAVFAQARLFVDPPALPRLVGFWSIFHNDRLRVYLERSPLQGTSY